MLRRSLVLARQSGLDLRLAGPDQGERAIGDHVQTVFQRPTQRCGRSQVEGSIQQTQGHDHFLSSDGPTYLAQSLRLHLKGIGIDLRYLDHVSPAVLKLAFEVLRSRQSVVNIGSQLGGFVGAQFTKGRFVDQIEFEQRLRHRDHGPAARLLQQRGEFTHIARACAAHWRRGDGRRRLDADALQRLPGNPDRLKAIGIVHKVEVDTASTQIQEAMGHTL